VSLEETVDLTSAELEEPNGLGVLDGGKLSGQQTQRPGSRLEILGRRPSAYEHLALFDLGPGLAGDHGEEGLGERMAVHVGGRFHDFVAKVLAQPVRRFDTLRAVRWTTPGGAA